MRYIAIYQEVPIIFNNWEDAVEASKELGINYFFLVVSTLPTCQFKKFIFKRKDGTWIKGNLDYPHKFKQSVC